MKKSQKTVFYEDELNDDFAATSNKIHIRRVDSSYKYHHSLIYRFFSFVLYRIIATPLVFIYCKLCFGLQVKNRRVLYRIKGGFLLYGNHTQNVADAFIPTLICFPRRCNIVTGPEAVSIPVIRHVVPLLGALPLASTVKGFVNLMHEMKRCMKKKLPPASAVAIYPEAHIWPYYNGIRPFTDSSFKYAKQLGVPAVGFCVTYRPRRILRNLPPLITVTVSNPVYPSEDLTAAQTRDRIYDFMSSVVKQKNSFEYIRYEKRPDAEDVSAL